MIVPGAGVGRTKKPKVVRHPPTMWRGGTTISRGRAYRHRAVATCCSGIMSCACLRDHLGGLVSPVGRTVKREGNVPTQYDHGEGSEGLERHVRRSARFFFPRRLLTLRRGAAYQQSGPRTSDMAERFTGPSRECMEWLGEMGPSADDLHGSLTGCTARALESELFQELACTAACESASRRYIHGARTDRRTLYVYRTRKFSEFRSGTLGPKRAREGPNHTTVW